MGMTEEEYARDEWLSDLYEEHREQALEEFKQERLQSYFLASPELAQAPHAFLVEARLVEQTSASAALVLASAAAEVGVKMVLLKPIVMGLVHSEALAGHVADLVMQHQGIDRFRHLLFDIMRQYAGVDLSMYRRPGVSATLWTEITGTAPRNRVCHRCESATSTEAASAISIAAEVLDNLFPAFVRRLGLHLHDGYRCCNDWHPDDALQALLREMRGRK